MKVEKENIVLRLKTIGNFSSRILVSKVKDETEFSLKHYIKNPMILRNKDNGLYYKIGVCNSVSINTTKPLLLTTRLLLDYDNDTNDRRLMKSFIDKFKDYSFMLHTTWSATKLKPKFRVILKLKNPLVQSCFEDKLYIERLLQEFEVNGCYPDRSCFRNTQCQLIPSIKKDGNYYFYHINKGKKYEVLDYKSVLARYMKEEEDSRNRKLMEYELDLSNNLNTKPCTKNVAVDIGFINSQDTEPDKEVFAMWKTSTSFKKSKWFKDRLKNINEREKHFEKTDLIAHKYDFMCKYASAYVHGKVSKDVVFNKWRENFGEDLTDNKKWWRKWKEWLKHYNISEQ